MKVSQEFIKFNDWINNLRLEKLKEFLYEWKLNKDKPNKSKYQLLQNYMKSAK